MIGHKEPSAIQDNYEYDVFISCKSEDYTFGCAIYEFLIEKGIRVFFADQELRNLGSSDYGSVIDYALDTAKHLIVIASNADFTKEKYSPYVYYEWKTFSEEKRSGRKTGNILTVVTDKFIVKSLPIALRNVQSFTFDEYQQVYNYVVGYAQSDPNPSPFIRIKNFILNFRIGKNFGCVVSIVLFVFIGAVVTPIFFLYKSSDSDILAFDPNDPSIERNIRYDIEIDKQGSRTARPKGSLAPREGTGNTSAMLANKEMMCFEPFIYYVRVVKIAAYDVPEDSPYDLAGGKWEYVFSDNAPVATGFITNDNYFITARQVVEPWAYFASEDYENDPFTKANILHQYGARIEVTLVVESNTGDRREMKSSDFRVFRHNDVTKTISKDFTLKLANGCDFACIKVNLNSTLVANAQLSQNLEAGIRLESLGFPYGCEIDKNCIRPQYTYMTTSSTGLSHGAILVNETNRLEMGNLGGPVFVKDGDTYYVVGLVTSSNSNKYSVVPISAVSF